MRLIKNTGSDRVIDEVRSAASPQSTLDLATPALSLFAFGEASDLLDKIARCRLVVPTEPGHELELLGGDADRPFRNRLNSRGLASRLASWLEKKVELRGAPMPLPQSFIAVAGDDAVPARVLTGHCAFTTDGLGLTPGNRFSLIQVGETSEECAVLGAWFEQLWNSLPATLEAKNALVARLRALCEHTAPSLVYLLVLFHLFHDRGEDLDEERIVKSATGIRNTVVWKKLYRFQRDGVVGAIDKLDRFGGCIIADSVGLGKTFEALAIIKYHELRNDRVLVLVPKRLRDNWTLYKANDRRNVLAPDRLKLRRAESH